MILTMKNYVGDICPKPQIMIDLHSNTVSAKKIFLFYIHITLHKYYMKPRASANTEISLLTIQPENLNNQLYHKRMNV